MGLLEALISLVFMTIMGLGITFVASRAAVAQRFMNAQNLAVNQLRYELQSGCASSATTTIVSSTCSLSSSQVVASVVTTVSGTLSATVSYNLATDSASSTSIGGQMTFNP